MNNPPIITVVTVCRNVKASLEKTMISVLHQNYPSVDYIVVDGASSDGTKELLEKTENLRWISEPDKGIYDAMNKGIRMAKGEWVLFMNAGDTFVSDNTIQKVFSEMRDADVIYGDVIKNGHIKQAEPPHNSHRMFFCHQCAFVRTDCLEQYPFDTNHRMSADFKQMKQLFLAGKRFLQIQFPIAIFDTSGISNTKRSSGLLDNIRVILETDDIIEQIRLLPRIVFTYWICKLRGR